MKKLLLLLVGLLSVVGMSAQNDEPTANWPYLYPDFMEGELLRSNKNSNKARFNIHLNISALHYVDKNGKIKEADTWGVIGLIIGEDRFRFVEGKMLKVMAESKGGSVVKESRANYHAIVKNDGAMGTTALNSTTTKTFLYNENAINQYNGYLLTDDWQYCLQTVKTAIEIRGDYASDHIESGIYSAGILQLLSTEIKVIFKDLFDDIRAEALDCSIVLYADTLCDVKNEVREGDFDLYKEDFELIKKYKPDFEWPIKICETPSVSNESGCYVATSIYGSYDCPQVWTLRRFRDNTLENYWAGRTFPRSVFSARSRHLFL